METIEKELSSPGFAETVRNGNNKLTITVPKDRLHETARMLRYNSGSNFDFLIDVVGMDYGDAGLGVMYCLSSSQNPAQIIVLKTVVAEREQPELFSVCDLWDSANVYEREVYDFFGIRFINHPDMRRIFLRPCARITTPTPLLIPSLSKMSASTTWNVCPRSVCRWASASKPSVSCSTLRIML